MSTAYLKNAAPVAIERWLETGASLKAIEELVGPDVIRYEAGALQVAGTTIPLNNYVIATRPTDYVAHVDADPDHDPPIEEVDEVLYVRGVFQETVDAAGLAAGYTIDT
jgi:hypothetical protein